MREAHPVERAVGMAYYVSDADGTGGRLRDSPADFRVRELEAVDPEPVEADSGSYPQLLLRVELRGWDTNDFAGALSDSLGISRERVSWAGTKDKHAVTTQLFSVDGVAPEDLPDLRDADLEVVGRVGRPVLFGDLAGNAFEVVVRKPDRPEAVEPVTDDLRAFAGADGPVTGGGAATDDGTTVGVPNHFGQQRFGSRRPVTHEVGLALVREGFEAAVLAYVGNPSDREPERTREARVYIEETRDWGDALERFPGHLGYERAMCHRLAEVDGEPGPADFRAALETAPRNLQQLFVNAAQSYVFNEILSARLERGLPFAEPVTGDIVCFRDREVDALAVPDTGRTQRVTDGRLETVRRHCERGRAFVTAPLVGTQTELADGEPGGIERAVLDEVGVEPADFDLPGEFHSEGARRAVLVRTDLEVRRDPLTFEFALPKGSYATVLLREYLKTDPEGLE
jgi:tRNA pseudouridine13 synthase